MKNSRTKLLLLLFASAIFGFSMANAYTFDVTNRNPFGTLNLSELKIKNSNNDTTIDISGYVVQINGGTQGTLIVHQICDGTKCVPVQDISTGNVSNTEVMTIISTAIEGDLPSILSTIQGNIATATGNIADNSNNIATITDQINGMVTGNNGYLCVKDGNTIKCNTLKFGDNMTGNGLCYFSEDEVIVCDATVNLRAGTDDTYEIEWPLAEEDVIGGIKVGYGENGKNYAVQLDEEKKAFVTVPRNGEGGGIEVKGEQPGKWCRYNCEKRKFKGSEDDRGIFDLTNPPFGTAESIIYSGCYVECGQPEPEKPEHNFWTGGDGTKGATVVLKNTETNMNIGGSSTTTHKLEVNGDVLFNDGLQVAHFTHSGVRFYGGMYFIKEKYAYKKEAGKVVKILESMSTGLSVNGPFAVGNADNYLYIDADGNSGDAGHGFDIMGNNELVIGRKNGAFLYFAPQTGTVPDPVYTGTIVGIENIEVPNAFYCQYGDRAGNSVSYNIFGGGIISPDPTVCSNQNTIANIKTGQLHNSSPVAPGKEPDAYKSLMIGVNNNHPVATLDVNGSIKVGNNCSTTTVCNYETQGTMLYLVRGNSNFGSLLICMANGFRPTTEPGQVKLVPIYQWYDVTRGIYGDDLHDLEYTLSIDQKCAYPRPKPISTDERIAYEEDNNDQ